MSTSILYHGFGLKHHRYLRTEYVEGTIIFHVETAAGKRRCAQCGSRNFIKKGKKIRRIRTLPIGKRPVFLAAHLYRLWCRACQSLRQEPVLWSRPKKRWTMALGRYIVDLLGNMTVEDVARYLGMSWDTIKEIHGDSLRKKFRQRRVRHLRYLGVDEVAVRKVQNYLTKNGKKWSSQYYSSKLEHRMTTEEILEVKEDVMFHTINPIWFIEQN
jgi:transposase